MSILRKIGILLIVSPALIWTGWNYWYRTRSWEPVDCALSVNEGSVTVSPAFKVNLPGTYEIEIQATGKNGRDIADVFCALGMKGFPESKNCKKSPLKATWFVTSDSQRVAEGSSESTEGGGAAYALSRAYRSLGMFTAVRGTEYQVHITALTDLSDLSMMNPKLRVSFDDARAETAVIISQMLKPICILMGIVGLVLFLAGGRRKHFR